MEDIRAKDATGADEAGKTFTQEDVNRIVSERLGKEREKIRKEQESALAEREKEISARELRINALDKLSSRGLPPELADVINCADEDTIDRSIEILARNCGGATPASPAYHPRNGDARADAEVRRAMGLA